MREERDMEKIKIKYLSDKIERLRYIDGKSDWIDLRAANHCGIVDESYCGNNDQWFMPAFALRDTVIEVNDRICQFRIFAHQPTLTFEETDDLGNEDRGGLGSTGKQ